MVTILQVVPRLEAGGSELATVEIAQALTRVGAKALVATEGGRLAGQIERAGGEIIDLPVASKNPLTIIANAHRLSRLVEARGIDLLHARSRAPAWSALLAARRRGRPFITTYHGAYGEVGPFKATYNSVMARGDRVIANSRYTASVIEARDPKAHDRIRVIYRGVDPAVFDPASVPPQAVERLKASWGVRSGARIVLHAARLTGIKGQRDVIAAASHLARQGALGDAVFILCGDTSRDAYRDELMGLIVGHGLGDKVRLVGHCKEMPAAYLASQVSVTTSTVPETFGRTSIEAQAMACPVIVPDIGALPETIVSPGQDPAHYTGWLTPSRNIEAIAACIGEALALSPEERTAIGVRARAQAIGNFTLARMQELTLAVYDEVLGTDLARLIKRTST